MTSVSRISPEVAARLPAVREAIAEGLSWRQIAQRLSLTHGQVEGMCHRWLRDEWAARPNPRPGFARQKPLEGKPVRRHREPAPEPPVVPAWVSMPVPPARSCQWPGRPWRRPWPFCGAACVPGKPYCAEHVAKAMARRVAA